MYPSHDIMIAVGTSVSNIYGVVSFSRVMCWKESSFMAKTCVYLTQEKLTAVTWLETGKPQQQDSVLLVAASSSALHIFRFQKW